MKKLDMDALVHEIVDSGMATMAELSGFEESDIEELERRHHVSLPATYKEFLLSRRFPYGSPSSAALPVPPTRL
jgi:hypothetical protein